ncbi:MAG: ABC transporter permease [Spirochaetes bacterium]|nr:ABC transporter permease [Spirochaetota bacterium]
MKIYIIKRILYAIPVIFGVMIITFALFFFLTTPRAIATQILGEKAKKEVIDSWIHLKGLDKPYFFNAKAHGFKKLTDTVFVHHMWSLLTFQFGNSFQDDKPITGKIIARAGPSLFITVPIFILGLFFSIFFSLVLAFFRSTYIDKYGTLLCVLSMAIVIMIYIISFQWFFGIILKLVPVSGWIDGLDRIRFIMLPVFIGVIASLGGGIRFYRTIMIEETNKDYVRTARAKGLGESAVLFKHILKNAMIPILTNAVMAIPFLFMGALLTENFFGIPGLGSFTVESLFNNDFPSIKAIIYIGAILYQVGLIITDISYAMVDPRIVFE